MWSFLCWADFAVPQLWIWLLDSETAFIHVQVSFSQSTEINSVPWCFFLSNQVRLVFGSTSLKVKPDPDEILLRFASRPISHSFFTRLHRVAFGMLAGFSALLGSWRTTLGKLWFFAVKSKKRCGGQGENGRNKKGSKVVAKTKPDKTKQNEATCAQQRRFSLNDRKRVPIRRLTAPPTAGRLCAVLLMGPLGKL